MSRPQTSAGSSYRATDPQAAHATFNRALRAVLNADPKQVNAEVAREQAERKPKQGKKEK